MEGSDYWPYMQVGSHSNCQSDTYTHTRARATLQQARAAGAVAMFGEKYDDVVRVVDVPGISMELCGGTHVSNTSGRWQGACGTFSASSSVSHLTISKKGHMLVCAMGGR